MKQKCNIKMRTENKKALGEIKTMAKKFYKSVEGWEDKVKDSKKNKNPNSCTLEEKKRLKKIMQLIQEIQCPNRRNNGKLIVSPERKNWKEEKKEKLLKKLQEIFPKLKYINLLN